MSVDKVDNQTIECMVCASCTFKGEKRQEERKIDRSEGEAGGRSQGDVEEEKIELSKNCQNGFRKNSRDAAQMDMPCLRAFLMRKEKASECGSYFVVDVL